ncbi:MAG TPA: hypothetical protein VFF52_18980 [Isosphaeraceae bacterium]|nr:hypothetical protein [Isosphaeraceae bacterium]
MSRRRSAGLVALGLLWLGAAGCDESLPPSGSRAIVPADHLEQQRARLEQQRADIKVQPSSRSAARR